MNVGASALKGVVKANAKVFGAVALGAVGLSGGQIDKGASMAVEGWRKGGNLGQTLTEDLPDRHRQKAIQKATTRNLARAVNNYKESLRDSSGNINISQDGLINDAMNLASGSKAPKTKEEEDLRDAMALYQDQLSGNGLDESDVNAYSRQMVRDIDDGVVSEYSRVQRFVGNVKGKINKKSSNKGKSQTGDENDTQNRYEENTQQQQPGSRPGTPNMVDTPSPDMGNRSSQSDNNKPSNDRRTEEQDDGTTQSRYEYDEDKQSRYGEDKHESEGRPIIPNTVDTPSPETENRQQRNNNTSQQRGRHTTQQNGEHPTPQYGEDTPPIVGNTSQNEENGNTPPNDMPI